MILAERYHWLPEQVDELDPDFAAELMARAAAESQYYAEQQKKPPRSKKGHR